MTAGIAIHTCRFAGPISAAAMVALVLDSAMVTLAMVDLAIRTLMADARTRLAVTGMRETTARMLQARPFGPAR